MVVVAPLRSSAGQMLRTAPPAGVMMYRMVAPSTMAYDLDAHQRLDDLATKYGNWYLSLLRSARDDGLPVYDADGAESTMSDCYDDAIVTAHALWVYLSDHPRPGQEAPPAESVELPSPLDLSAH
jgi:hypothetical protein